MKRLTFYILVLLAAIGLGGATLTAQEAGTSIVFVDSQAAIAAHPAGEEADALRQQASEELGGLRTDLDAIAQRARAGEQLTPEEQERYNTLLRTLQQVDQRYRQQIEQVAAPAIEAVNNVIREVAQEQGYSIVLDIGAASDGLVVYAQDGLNITPQVLERVRALQ